VGKMGLKAERDAWTAFVEGKQNAAPGPAVSNKNNHAALAMGRLKSGERNSTEIRYEQHLELRRLAREIVWYGFEPITFKLADDTRYTPDYGVLLANGIFECHEIKGTTKVTRKSGEEVPAPYFMDDSKVKIKVAAALMPFVFKVVYRVDKNWIEKEF
jgi:hypothetical protein